MMLGYARSPPSLSSLALSPFCSDPCSRRTWGGCLHQYPGGASTSTELPWNSK